MLEKVSDAGADGVDGVIGVNGAGGVGTADKVRPRAFLVQALSTLCIAYLTGLIGFVYAWPSYTLANLTSNATVLTRPLTPTEVSALGSLTNVGAFFVTPSCGYLLNTLGRKYSAMLFGIPFAASWAMLCVVRSPAAVLAAVALAGVGAGGQAVSSLYIAEISHDAVRGGLTSTCVSGYFVGLLFSYVIGGQLSYSGVLYTHLALSFLYILLLALLKESPVFLLQKGRDQEAAKSIAFYRQCSVDSEEVEQEIRKIRLQLNPRIERILLRENDTETTEELLKSKDAEPPVAESSWQFLKRSESSKRALACCLVLMAANIMMGAIVLQVYAEPLFAEAVPSMPANLCAIFLASDLLVASLVCAVTVDRFGRKGLMSVTSALAGVATLLLAAQLQLRVAPPLATALLIYAYCFVYNLGAATVPYILAAEVFLPEVRGLCNSLVMMCMWVSNFVTLVVFPALVARAGLPAAFYLFSGVCALTAAYAHRCLPETRGLPTDQIQLRFLKNARADS